MISKRDAKEALDKIISKSRIHFYKPIQIAEILYRIRKYGDVNPLNLEEYRNESKRWRDEISIQLLGRRCTSSARFQDDLFNDNAIPPKVLNTLMWKPTFITDSPTNTISYSMLFHIVEIPTKIISA